MSNAIILGSVITDMVTAASKNLLTKPCLLDPVSKIRVSTPEALIDTDFEYGLQNSKWETLEEVCGIPTFFSRTGDAYYTLSNVTCESGSDIVTVTTVDDHNFSVGSPFIITGTESPTADGSYIVYYILNSKQFIYKAKQTQTISQLYDPYSTTLYPARIYQGNMFGDGRIKYIETDSVKPNSTLKVGFYNPHGLQVNTGMTLYRSIGNKATYFNASNVDTSNVLNFTNSYATGSNIQGVTTNTYTSYPIVPHDWLGKGVFFFTSCNVDVAGNKITLSNHNLTSNDNLVYFQAAPPNTPVGGLVSECIYKVNVVDAHNIRLSAYDIPAPSAGLSYYGRLGYYYADTYDFYRYITPPITGVTSNISSITSVGFAATSSNYSLSVEGYFKPTATGTWSFTLSAANKARLWIGTPALKPAIENVLINNSNESTTVIALSNSITLSNNVYYPIRILQGCRSVAMTTQNLILSFSGPGVASRTDGTGYYFRHTTITNANFTSNNVTITSAGTSKGQSHMFFKGYVVNGIDTATATINIDYNTSNSTLASLLYGQKVAFMSKSPTYGFGFGVPGPFATSSVYNVNNSNDFFVPWSISKPFVTGDVTTDITVNSSANGTNAPMVRSNVSGLAFVIPTQDTSYVNCLHKGDGLVYNNATLQYTVLSGTGVGNLVSGTTYYIDKIDNNWFRLKNTSNGAFIPINSVGDGVIQFVRTQDNPTANVITVPSHGFVSGQTVKYSMEGNTVIGGLMDTSNYIVNVVTKDTVTLQDSSNNTIDLTTVGTGTQKLTLTSGGTDDTYTISAVPAIDEIAITAPYEIPYREFTFDPKKTLMRDTGLFYLPGHDLFPARFNKVVYLANGNTPIGGLTDNATYYANRYDSKLFGLATTNQNSTILTYSSFGTGTNHTLRFYNVAGVKWVSSNAEFTSTSTETTVKCVDEDFLSTYRVSDFLNLEIDVATYNTYYSVNSITTASNTIALSATPGYGNGTLIYYTNNNLSLTPISNLQFNQYYYSRIPIATSSNVIALYPTYADAIASTNQVTIASSNDMDGYFSWNAIVEIVGINTTASTVTTTPYVSGGFATGNFVIYTAGASAIGGLSNNFIYCVNTAGLGNNQFALFTSSNDAYLNINRVTITNTGASAGGTFTKIMNNLSVFPTINQIKSSTEVQCDIMATQFNVYTTKFARLFHRTQMAPTVNGLCIHRAFDGGVQLVPSTSPGSKIVRQTRRYFRYQSGKGMQMSKSVNFSAPTDIYTYTLSGNTGTITTKYYHRLQAGSSITITNATGGNSTPTTGWNGVFTVTSVVNATTFTIDLGANHGLTTLAAEGYPRFIVNSWNGSSLRVGMFDEQNGMFFEYDGSTLYVVRRSSTKQLPGYGSVTFCSHVVSGTNTKFLSQLVVGDKIVIKGMTYKVTSITNDTTMNIMPAYRGVTNNFVTVSVTSDYKVPQSQWNIDKCNGTGASGYNLNINKIQMVYMDYSWYGAGKARFGFKDVNGEVMYCHEFLHNNYMDEAYIRSGNLPARYEVENTGDPTYVPALMHWGTSVIIDGGFDDDRLYLFSASGLQLSYANGDVADVPGGSFTNYGRNGTSGTSPAYVVYSPVTGGNVSCYRLTFPASSVANLKTGSIITSSLSPDTILAASTKVMLVTISGTTGYVYINKIPLVASVTNQGFLAGDPTDFIPSTIPLVSIRLAPSVDSNRPGALGSREIINRMHLILSSAEILTSHDLQVNFILNGISTNKDWVRTDTVSLSQLILHDKGDSLTGGVQIYTVRAAGGQATSTGQKISNSTFVDLSKLMVLSNSINGGDDVYPNGPDILTVCVSVLDTTGISSASRFNVTGRISWSESQV